MEKLSNTDIYTVKAAGYFNIDENDVTPKQIKFIRDQERASNYGGYGMPLRSYSITEEGTVEFTAETSKQLIQDASWLLPDQTK